MLPRSLLRLCIAFPASILAESAMSSPPPPWKQLAPIPDPVGFAAPFAGVHNDALIVAGGANFPGKPPWEGGQKVWHDRVFVLQQPDGQWQEAGRLPRPIGYGVSLTTPDGILCIGGSDSQQHFRDVFLLQWIDGKLTTKAIPPLPQPCANACGVLIGKIVYIAGGQETPTSTTALHTFWTLDLSEPALKWKTLEPWPGPARILATAAAQDGSFYLFGGAALSPGLDDKSQRTWLRDAYCYTPSQGWQKLPDMPRATVAAPSPAPSTSNNIVIFGGDDGAQLQASPNDHQGFPKTPLVYDILKATWRNGPSMPFSLVTTTTVIWRDHLIIPGGEAKPGIRSTQVWSLSLKDLPSH